MADKYTEKEAELRAQLRNMSEERMRECDHKPINGKPLIVNVHDTNEKLPISDRERNKLPPDTVICKRCGATFSPTAFTSQEISDMRQMLLSMFEQIKFMSSLNDEEKKQILLWYKATDDLANMIRYYESMVDSLGQKNKGNNGGGRQRKGGGIGVSAADFGSRGY